MSSVSVPTKTARRASTRLRLSYDQVKQLSLDNYPVAGPGGKVTLSVAEDRPNMKNGRAEPYRFMDGSADAPTGFRYYVGKHGARYEMTRRVGKRVTGWTIGPVDAMRPEAAYEEARRQLETLHRTGEHPKRVDEVQQQLEALKRYTLRQCFEHYIDKLTRELAKGRVKQVSVDSVRDSLARLSREEVGLADKEIRHITADVAEKAMEAVRMSAQRRTNAIPTRYREKLEKLGDWSLVPPQQLAALDIPGHYIQRIRASGLAAAEHTMGDAIRAVDSVIKWESRNAFHRGDRPVIYANPLRSLMEDGRFRNKAALSEHYRKAKKRNPLGERDGSLAKVLKVLIARRDEQSGLNATAADYLLLTLLWGARRSETARLCWYDKCTKAELIGESVSWVWLGKPDEINPITGLPGSQVYFHDTKSSEVRHIPIGYFAERILRRREMERDELEAKHPARIAAAEKRYKELKKVTGDAKKLGAAHIAIERLKEAQPWKWVFPARSSRAKSGHYSDSKSILRNVRRDAGMLDLDKEIDIGLTPHDLRRTMGRFAEARYGNNRVVSKILHHKTRKTGEEMADVTERYAEPEWPRMREVMLDIDNAMIETSPRVYNRLKGPDKPKLSEADDPPVEIFAWKQQALTDEA